MKIALVASFLFALSPIQVRYSTLFCPHTLASFFSLLTFASYLWWTKTGRTKYYIGIYASFVLGAFSDWVTYFVVLPILLHYLIWEYKKIRNLKFMLFFALMPLASFSIHLGCGYALGGKQALEGLLDRFLIRAASGGSAEGVAGFTLWDLYTFGYIRAKLFLTPIACLLSAAWPISCLATFSRKELSRPNSFVLALFLFGFSHNLVFSNRVYYHDILMFLHFTPVFAIAAALGAQFFVKKMLRKRWIWVTLFVALISYSFGAQSISALRWLFNAPVWPDFYLVGSKVNEITDENTKVISSFEPDFQMLFYADRVWNIVTDLDTLTRLSQADSRYSLYVLDPESTERTDRNLKEYLVRNHPVETFYGYSFFDLQETGSNTLLPNPEFSSQAYRNPQIEHPTQVNFDDKLLLLGYNVQEVIQKKKEPSWLKKYLKGHAELLPEHRTFFHITYFWQCLEEMEKDYTLTTHFEGHHGKTYRINQNHQGLNGLYPTSMWQVGEVIREEYQVEVPADYPPIRYALWAAVRDGDEGLKVSSDLEADDEENRVRLGQIEVLPPEKPSPLTGEPRPQNRVEVNINDELLFLGYDLSKRNLQPGDQLRVTTYWHCLKKTERDYAIQVELKNGSYKLREVVDIAPSRLWEEGRAYRGDTAMDINPHILGGTYSLNLGLKRDDGTGTQVSLASLDIPYHRQHIITRLGKANYGGEEILSPQEPLSLHFDLDEQEPLEIVAGWTGKSEFDETRVEVYISRPYSHERYLGTWVIGSDRYTTTKRRIPSSLTAPGQNVIELRVPELRERVHNVGWRGLLDLLFPDLLQDISPVPYDGAIQMDFAQVSAPWKRNWDDYYHLAKLYAERGMQGEVVSLYQEAVDQGVEPAQVDDWALFREAYVALEEEGRVREIEERIARRIAHKMNVNLQGKVEFLGYSLRAEESNRHGLGLFFRCLEEMEQDYTLWVHAEVEDETLLERTESDRGYAIFDHLLFTSRWKPGTVYQDDEIKGLRPGRYHFTLGLWRPEDGSRLWRKDDPNAHIVDLGWVKVQ